MQCLRIEPFYVQVLLAPESRTKVAKFYTSMELRGFKPLPIQELHVSIFTSKTSPSDLDVMLMRRPIDMFTATVTDPIKLGDWTVLMLDSPELERRHEEWSSLGLVYAWPKFIPHLSFAKTDMVPELALALREFSDTVLTFSRETVIIGP